MIPWKLVGIGVAVLSLVGAFLYVRHLQNSNERLAQTLSQVEASLTAERENTRKANAASERYAISLETLKAVRERIPTRAVRLCNGPSVRESGTATGTDAPNAEELQAALGQHPGNRWTDSGPDIGPELYALADEADKVAAQCAALQGWIRSR